MKKTYILLAALLTCTAVLAAAQSFKMPPTEKQLSALKNNITRSLERASEEYRRNQKRSKSMPANVNQKADNVCAYCGEEITNPCQHCATQNSVGLCTPCAVESEPAPNNSLPGVCPDCGHPYTIDEQYHGVPHECSQGKAEVCAECGEEISGPYQHCRAQDFTGICYPNNKKPEVKTNNAEHAGCCPDCGHPYTIDEQHHGVPHECPAQKTHASDNWEDADPEALVQAETLLQADRDAHNGAAEHNLEYYYKQVVSANAKQK